MQPLDNLNKQFNTFTFSLKKEIKNICELDSMEWALLTKWDKSKKELIWASPEAQEEYNKSQFGIWDLGQLAEHGWCYNRTRDYLITIDEGPGETWDVLLEDIDSGMEFISSGVNIKSINVNADEGPDASWRRLAAIACTFYGYGSGMGIEWAIEALIRGKRKEQNKKQEKEIKLK